MRPNFTTGLIAHSNTVYCGPAPAAPADLLRRRDFALPDPAATHQRVTILFAADRLRHDVYARGLDRFNRLLELEAGVPA